LAACLLACCSRKNRFFVGRNNYDQLVRIAKVLGTADLMKYLEKYDLQLDSHFDGLLGKYTRKSWRKFITDKNRHLVSDDAIDFLDKLLQYDHEKRLTCQEAMAHAYFDPVRKKEGSTSAETEKKEKEEEPKFEKSVNKRRASLKEKN